MKPRPLAFIGLAVVAVAVLIGFLWQSSLASPSFVEFGDAAIGQNAIKQAGCGACHQIPGVRSANGKVGPPLGGVASRSFIAGRLANNPENMIRWLRDPQEVSPGTAMPDLGLTRGQARDIAAYLSTLD